MHDLNVLEYEMEWSNGNLLIFFKFQVLDCSYLHNSFNTNYFCKEKIHLKELINFGEF